MLKSFKIENFRGFQSFELQQLGRINLLVGENNSGKTSILEAIQLFYSRANLAPLTQVMYRRGELLQPKEYKIVSGSREPELDIRYPEPELDICHLFYNHEVDSGSQFVISGLDSNFYDSLTASITHQLEYKNFSITDKKGNFATQTLPVSELSEYNFTVTWKFGGENEVFSFPLSVNDGLSLDYTRRPHKNLKDSTIKIRFITPFSPHPVLEMIELFETIVLTPEESVILSTLQKIDSRVAGIAPQALSQVGGFGRFKVLLSGVKKPVPIGSLGDGILRILNLILSALNLEDGILLVDEIDAGLHFNAMINMWRVIWETAKQLNVQVFAATHSRDCWESLAELVESEKVETGEIVIHRIEKGKPHSVIFDDEMMVIAANQGIEVR